MTIEAVPQKQLQQRGTAVFKIEVFTADDISALKTTVSMKVVLNKNGSGGDTTI